MPREAKGAPLSLRPHPDPDAGVLVLGAITRAGVPAVCERVHALAQVGDGDVIVCEVGALGADILAIEVLARLQLTARRHGCRLMLRHASRELETMVALCGLRDALPASESPRRLPDFGSHRRP